MRLSLSLLRTVIRPYFGTPTSWNLQHLEVKDFLCQERAPSRFLDLNNINTASEISVEQNSDFFDLWTLLHEVQLVEDA